MKQPQPTINTLQDIHAHIIEFPILLRERICEECSWSIPTFYRKMRAVDKISESKKPKIIPALSNAEREMVITVVDEVFKSLWDYMEKYRPPRK